ncbi:MAG: hypothetical protein A2167_07165 [Planctomycetes bacterium RBG_13_46_10]|nr:MAG: hypothetical protein A2167_07165 [Planctomycetes bacterium RBG_13_46_10]
MVLKYKLAKMPVKLFAKNRFVVISSIRPVCEFFVIYIGNAELFYWHTFFIVCYNDSSVY